MPSGSLTRGASATSTPLAGLLAQRIRAHGPITYADWMAAALYHPRHGYYRRGRPTVGRAGDFLTSPEVHPIFGAATAQLVSSVADVLVASVAGALGRPPSLRVVEVGPGTGALAESLLTALDTPIELTLIESDPVAAAAQRQRLARFTTPLEWCDDIASAPAGAQIVIANELLDAQPVHRLRYDNEWVELMVDWSPDSGFVDHPAPLSNPALAAPLAAINPRPGQIAEVSPARASLVAQLADLITDGLLLLFDYGYPRHELYDPRRHQGTLMTFRRHVPGERPYAYPGEQDITCHIDLDQVTEAAASAGLAPRAPVSQADWLQALRPQILPAGDLSARRALEALSDPEGLGRIAVIAATRGPIDQLAGLDRRTPL